MWKKSVLLMGLRTKKEETVKSPRVGVYGFEPQTLCL